MKKMGLLVCLAIALLAVGGFVYFRYFATVYDKEGMVVSTGSKADQEDPSGKRDTKLEEEPIDGGVTDASDPQAPRSIQSSELISFSCWFSTLPMEDSPLGSKLFDLEAKLAGDQVQGQYRVSETMGSWQEQSFEADASFMEELNGILDSFDAAGYNGLSHHTAGIPEEYGAVLEAEYASGESIFASDNEDNFLSYGLMDALDKLFARTAADVPVPIAVSVKDEFRHETAGTGDYFISYPTYHIKKGDKPLKDALRTINEEHRGEAADAEERMKQAVGEKSLYYQSEPFFTRGDDRVVAAYERLMRMESQDQPQDIVEYRTYNIDVRTGKELGFADVFRDMEHLPGLIAEEVVRAYPERTFYDEMTELISTSVSSEDESISFALAYGGVHIFADEYYLSREPGSLHILLDTASAPDQWKAAYETMPERFIVPLDYDSDYAPEDISFRFRMEWENVPQTAGGVWRVLSRGSDAGTGMEESDAAGYGIAYEEEYDGYAPECWLAHCQGDNYIFLKAPAGDTSQKTYFYRVSSQGIILIGSMDIAMNRETPLDPDAMWMNTNQVISKEPLQLMAVGIYTLGDDGFPSHPRKVHRLVGKEVVLKGDQRLNPSRREDAAVSGGMWNLAGGTVLYPYRSDLKSWIDFRTEDGRICRFAINEFSDQVVLDRFRLEDLFE